MKKKMIKVFLSIFTVMFLFNCATNTAMNSYGVTGPSIMIDDESIESSVSIDGRIHGEGSKT